MTLRSRHRRYKATIALTPWDLQWDLQKSTHGEPPDFRWRERTEPRDFYSERCLSKVPTIIGQADSVYQRGQEIELVVVPDDCDYWLDNEKLVIAKRKKVCHVCGNFLVSYDGLAGCPVCDGGDV